MHDAVAMRVLEGTADLVGEAKRLVEREALLRAPLQERRGLALVFATHDAPQAMAARSLGFECVGA